jgi:hypothetical protein
MPKAAFDPPKKSLAGKGAPPLTPAQILEYKRLVYAYDRAYQVRWVR